MRLIASICVAAILVSGRLLAAEAPTASPTASPAVRACLEHFTEEGSFFKGKTYRTWQEFPGADKTDVFQAVAQAVAQNNWGHMEANKDLMIVTAGQEVTMGEGAQAPLNVIVKNKGDSVRVEAVFGTGPMQKASTDTVRTELCKLVEAPTQD